MVADTCIDIFIVSLDCKLTRLSVGIFSELRILIKIYLSMIMTDDNDNDNCNGNNSIASRCFPR